jgi:hypothetical protein
MSGGPVHRNEVRRAHNFPGIQFDDFVSVWSHSYHVTFEANLESMRNLRILWPARTLLEDTEHSRFIHERRTRDLMVPMQGERILLRNQIPLDPGSIDLGTTATLQDYVACLNSYVFFWPGSCSGPIQDGRRMFQRTGGQRSIVIRMETRSLIDVNPGVPIYVTTCNSGATWTEGGNKVRRSPDIFRRLDQSAEMIATIHEICFRTSVHLPEDAECGTALSGPWSAL